MAPRCIHAIGEHTRLATGDIIDLNAYRRSLLGREADGCGAAERIQPFGCEGERPPVRQSPSRGPTKGLFNALGQCHLPLETRGRPA